MSRFQALPVLAATSAIVLTSIAAAPYAERGRAMVSSDHELAAAAGAAILADGGNAIDAAVATALAAGVVQPAGSGLGGGGFAVVVRPGQSPMSLDFREVAPGAATRDMYRTADGGVESSRSRKGGLAVGVPGEPKGLAQLLACCGTMSHAEVAAPAIDLAKGFPMGHHLAGALVKTGDSEVQELFGVGRKPPLPGDTVSRKQLAKTLKRWAATESDYLYTGAGAAAIAQSVQRSGGLITVDDLAGYTPREREPIVATYKGHTLVTMAPPSSGGVFLAQMLGVLEGFDLAELGHNSSDYVHVLTEAMKHAYADRAHHMGDPDFADVPTAELMGDARVDEIRKKIYPSRTFEADWYGEPFAPHDDAGTQHISVIDRDGNAVALTTTINTSFGSGVVVPELGIVLNNEMDDFAAAPGVPNAYGLVGQEANAVAAGKRPLSSMTPTIVLDAEGKVVMSIGASGGSFIITSVLQVYLNIVEFGLDPQEAVAAPRFHHQWAPDKLVLEQGFPLDVRRSLQARGHTLADIEPYSSCQVVAVGEGGELSAGADPRKAGWPAGVW